MSRKIFILSVLYFVQGMPYGFQLVALPVYLRAEGFTLAGIGITSALFAQPWIYKAIWGPLVDRYGLHSLGRRRTWILPLQLGLMLSCAVTAFLSLEDSLIPMLIMIFLMNLFAATMDVAVDGLAVDLLRPEELGHGNIAQVVGYKMGMLTGGGLLVWASDRIGWQGLFLGMATLVGIAFLITLSFRETSETPHSTEPAPKMGNIFRALWAALRLPGTGWLLLFIATYKLGETLADAMFNPFLFDRGFSAQQIGLWVGTWGMLFSLAGSFLGGMLASRIGPLWAVAWTALLRAVAVGGEWWLSLVVVSTPRVVGVVAAEQLFGGALTTALFAFMMSRVDRRIGATHYTLLATVEVTGKMVARALSGYIADWTSYPVLFGLATLLALGFLVLLIPIIRAEQKLQIARSHPQTP